MTCTRDRSAARCRTRCTPWPTCWRACTTATAGSRCPGSTTRWLGVSAAEREMFAQAAVRRAGVARRGRPQPCRGWRGRVQHAGADLGPADRRDQRDVGRAHRPGRQDDHPEPGPREALVPAGREPGARPTSRPRCGEYVAQRTPPGIEATVTIREPGVRPCFSPVDSPAVARGQASHEPRVRAGRPLHPGRRQRPGGGPGRDPRARRWSSWPSAWTPTASTRRTRRSRWRCC